MEVSRREGLRTSCRTRPQAGGIPILVDPNSLSRQARIAMKREHCSHEDLP
jgi:hypothetical protein